MAHSPKHYTEMGRLVADAGKQDWHDLTAEYGAMLMDGLSVRSPACTVPQAQVSKAKGWAREGSM
jgi:uncharacterized protein YbgA (DUF1722 family)